MVIYESWKKNYPVCSNYDRINMTFDNAKSLLETINKTIFVDFVTYRKEGFSYIVYMKTNHIHPLDYTFKFTHNQFFKVKSLLVKCNGGYDLEM